MGKKTRKTRWRALEITGESDSEESNTLSTQTSKGYGHRPYYSKFTYSSQSTPTRRYQHDAKSTRSSSTASETKITFNEDEYTKITTPRQDVLFKKGYLNKPKTYQTQTSTGNSTASTGNSTGNGTPDHQSADGAEGTDLEYESQFVFPNGFVDHHGVYYINSFEPYPLVMYNPPICYPEYPISRSKRHSTGSLTESTSPHNEEASQEFSQSGGETSGTVPEGNHVYNVVYPGYYYDGICGPNMVPNGQAPTEPRKVRKKRRRRVSKNVPQDGSTSSEDYESSDDAVSQIENRAQAASTDSKSHENNLRISIEHTNEAQPVTDDTPMVEEETKVETSIVEVQKEIEVVEEEKIVVEDQCKDLAENDQETTEAPTSASISETTPDEGTKDQVDQEVKTEIKHSKFNLNAQEFYPRAYRSPDQHQLNPNFHFVDMPHPNFIPLPFVNHPELGPPGFNPQFLPPGIPMGFVPHDPKLVPNFVNFVPNQFYPKPFEHQKPSPVDETEKTKAEGVSPSAETPAVKEEVTEKVAVPPPVVAKKTDVDIAKIVSKLEEAAKEQILQENQNRRYGHARSPHKYKNLPRHRLNGSYNHSDSGYRSSGHDRRRHFDRSRRSLEHNQENRPVEDAPNMDSLTSDPLKTDSVKPEQVKPEEVAQQSEALPAPSQVQPEIKTESKHRQPEEVASKENSRHGSPRHTNYKNQYQSPRRFNHYNKNATPRATPEVSHPPTVNYSETLKRQITPRKPCPRHERTLEKRDANISSTPKKEEDTPAVKETSKITKSPSQWISVSNRKKRKNKTANEEEIEMFHEEETSTATIVETEVLILTKEEELMINGEDSANQDVPEPTQIVQTTQIDTFIEMVAKESSPMRIIPDKNEIINGDTKIVAQDIQDVEKELLKDIVQDEILIAEVSSLKEEVVTPTDELVATINWEVSTPKEELVAKSKGSSKKKSKKGAHRLCPKRIIIKDVDFSKDFIDAKPAEVAESPIVAEVEPEPVIEKIEEQPEPVEPITQEIPEEPIAENTTDADAVASAVMTTSTPDKKKPKKKKKSMKPVITANQSASSSSTTLNVIDDSYDFLLDTCVLVDDKTNVEVSQELDKMIQRGLYGSLEEKMKSLNVSITEDFFKSLSLDKPATPDKGFIKATDFSSILKNTNQLLSKSKPESTKLKVAEGEPQPSTSKDCAFLELPQVKTEESVNVKSKSNGKLKNKSKKNAPKNDEAPLAGQHDEEVKRQMDNSGENSKNEDVDSLLMSTNNSGEISSSGEENSQVPLGDSGIDENAKEVTENRTVNCEENAQNEPNENQITANLQFTRNPIDDQTVTTNGVQETILVNGHNEDNNLEEDFKQLNGYKETTINFQERYTLTTPEDFLEEAVNQNHNEDKICCKTYETFQVEEAQTNGFIDITLSPFEDHERKDSTGNVSDAMEATDENITSDLTRPQKSITQAVFEWMTKTRENTPEVEILKSPDTINRELANNDESDLDEEEITIFENCCEVKKPECNGAQKIEEAEDVLEVYESKYGKNEDFLKLKAEIEEHKKKGKHHPKHGDLPYRAICCSLM